MERLWELVAEDNAMSDMILRAFMARRALLVGVGAGIKLIGSRFSPDSRRLREFLARNQMPYIWVDLETDDEAEGLLSGLGVAASETPVVIASGGEILRNPSARRAGRGARARLALRAPGALRRGRRRRRSGRDLGHPLRGLGGPRRPRGGVRRRRRSGRDVEPDRELHGLPGGRLWQRAHGAGGFRQPSSALVSPPRPRRFRCAASLGTMRSSSRTAPARPAVRLVIATGRPVPPARRPSARRVRGRRRLLRRHAGRGAALPRRAGGRGRRRQLRGSGGDVPLQDFAVPAADPGR